MSNQNRLFLVIVVFFFLMLVSSLDVTINNDSINNTNEELNNVEIDENLPELAVSDPYQKSNSFLMINEPFSDLNN